MLLSEIYVIADSLAPKSLSDEMCAKFGFYDNSGVLVDAGEPINSILFSLDFSEGAVEKAIALKANLIITHHPAIYGKISDITMDDPLGKKLVRCLKNGISVVSMHLNLDTAAGGLDEALKEGVLRAAGQTTGAGTSQNENNGYEPYLHPLMQGAYGRVYEIPGITLGLLVEGMKKEFTTDRVLSYGGLDMPMKKAASFCGAGADESAVAFAKAEGADVIISADFKHHIITMAQEAGLSLIILTHYASENYGFKKYYEKISEAIGIPCVLHEDRQLL